MGQNRLGAITKGQWANFIAGEQAQSSIIVENRSDFVEEVFSAFTGGILVVVVCAVAYLCRKFFLKYRRARTDNEPDPEAAVPTQPRRVTARLVAKRVAKKNPPTLPRRSGRPRKQPDFFVA